MSILVNHMHFLIEWLWDDYFDQPYAMFGNYDRLETDVKNETVLIKGKAIDRNYIEKDRCSFRGRYVGVETIEVDGISYTVPVINAHEETNEGFTASQIKTIAKTVFGDDITLSESRLQIPEFNIDDFLGYIVTLDNQTNAKFNKYSLSPYGGIISDASDDKPENIERYIEFAPDFNHFFLFSYDSSFENLTLEYYDNDYNIIWKREFENTTSAIYDYTQYNAYVVANGYLYIINMDTGEDSFEKSYVGSKIEIRKIENGILLFDKSRSDAIMMTDNQGNILWTSNLNQQLWDVKCIQFKENDVMVCEIESLKDEYVDEATEEEFYDWYFYQEYIQIDLNSGDVVLEVTSDYDFQ